MNPVRSKAATPALGKLLEISLSSRAKSRISEQVDCCGQPITRPVKQADIVTEKNVDPSTFHTWKPKIPELDRCVIGVRRDPCPGSKKKRKCYAGMQGPPCTADIKKKAELHFVNSIPCLEVPKQKKGSMKMESQNVDKNTNKSVRHSMKSICLPVPDWNHDGVMD